jgi:hypothetical protein
MLMREFHGTATIVLDAAPADVFATLVDIRRLPEWNAGIEKVVEGPPRPIAEGVEWVVQMHALGTRWRSRSRVALLDHDGLRFEHTSHTDDGNPSFAVWSWQVTPRGRGCLLSVSWAGHPKTFWRRALFSRLRAPALDSEVHASLEGLDGYLARIAKC